MAPFTRGPRVCILQCILVCLNRCFGEIKLCTNNSATLFAMKESTATVALCVRTEGPVHEFVRIKHHNLKPEYYRNNSAQNNLYLLITGEKPNWTINITFNELEDRHFGLFVITVYKDAPEFNKKVTFWLKLKRYESTEATKLRLHNTSQPPISTQDVRQEHMMLYLYITVPGVLIVVAVAITGVLCYRYRVKSGDFGESDNPDKNCRKQSMQKVISESCVTATVHCQETGCILPQEDLLYTTIATQSIQGKPEPLKESEHTLSEEVLLYTTIAKKSSQGNMNQSKTNQETGHFLSEEGLVYATVAKQTNQENMKSQQVKHETGHTISNEGLVYTTIASQTRQRETTQTEGKKKSDDSVEYTTLNFNKDRVVS